MQANSPTRLANFFGVRVIPRDKVTTNAASAEFVRGDRTLPQRMRLKRIKSLSALSDEGDQACFEQRREFVEERVSSCN